MGHDDCANETVSLGVLTGTKTSTVVAQHQVSRPSLLNRKHLFVDVPVSAADWRSAACDEAIPQFFPPIYCAIMLLLLDIAEQIAKRRKAAGLSRSELAKRSLVSRSTLEALENGRIGELGYAKVNKILTALGLELKLQEANFSRPTLDELLIENSREDALLR